MYKFACTCIYVYMYIYIYIYIFIFVLIYIYIYMYICAYIYMYIYIYIIFIYLFTVILRAVARDMLYVTRMIGGFVPVLFSTDSQTFPVSPSISLSSLFHLFSSLCFCAVACSVLCCVVVCRCVVCLELNSFIR